MPFTNVPGASLYYEVHGDGPWLAFAHGAGGNHLSWWQQVPAFASRFRCLVYDQRGWGRSMCEGAPEPTRFAPDLVALLDTVGATRAALIGQSMGGWTVAGCALAIPERVTHLVLTGTLGGLTDDDMIGELLSIVQRPGPLDGRLALAADFPIREPVKTYLFEQIAGLNPALTPGVLAALLKLRYPADSSRLRMPIAFIAGERDQLFPPDLVRRTHAKLPDAQLTMVPVAGHSVYFECPEVFNDALAAFLASPCRDATPR